MQLKKKMLGYQNILSAVSSAEDFNQIRLLREINSHTYTWWLK